MPLLSSSTSCMQRCSQFNWFTSQCQASWRLLLQSPRTLEALGTLNSVHTALNFRASSAFTPTLAAMVHSAGLTSAGGVELGLLLVLMHAVLTSLLPPTLHYR